MKKEDLLKLQHIAVIDEGRLLQLKAEDGYVICNYKKGMDMTDYMSTKLLLLPVQDEYLEKYSTIAIDKDKQHIAEKNKAMAAMNE